MQFHHAASAEVCARARAARPHAIQYLCSCPCGSPRRPASGWPAAGLRCLDKYGWCSKRFPLRKKNKNVIKMLLLTQNIAYLKTKTAACKIMCKYGKVNEKSGVNFSQNSPACGAKLFKSQIFGLAAAYFLQNGFLRRSNEKFWKITRRAGRGFCRASRHMHSGSRRPAAVPASST